ncbi:MAG TPA: NUDIX hydrolase [Dinghuibacter sp.]|uniref:NUDIX hydrolase n=1 Tax=Dinghuibacter sp. TaxID=2024697 RepID=UPI002CD5F8CA|nr:NUDIX hydrolase [Dinghuibacter sp.]HTJ11268.1 NUDIX hydrolase [Dinghuibacter sp.]
MTQDPLRWEVLDSTYISRHQYFTARRDRCRRPDGVIVPEYYVVELPPSVCVVALTEDREAVMIRQYRHPIAESILEIPGGFIDPGEDPATAARRELLEETGYAFQDIVPLGRIAANPGLLDNYTWLFLATGGKKVQGQHLDPNEEIEIILQPLDEVREMVLGNRLAQALHTVCFFYAFRYLGDL